MRSCFYCIALAVASIGVACHDTIVGPPAKVRVTLTLVPLPPNEYALAAPSIVVAGDSVVARDAINASGCADYTAAGQAPMGQLSLMIVATDAANRYCIPEGTATEAIVVAYGLPPGSRTARLFERTIRLDGSTHDNQVVQTTIEVP